MLDKIYAEQFKVIKTKVVSIDTTVSNIYSAQVQSIKLEKSSQRRQEQEKKRNEGDKKLLQNILAKDKEEGKDKKKDKSGGFLGKILAGFLGGSLIKSLLNGIFGTKGLLGTLLNGIFGEKGLVRSLISGLFGKEGLFIKAWTKLTSKDGALAKAFGKVFGKDSALGKSFIKLKNSLDDLIKKLPGGKFLKNLGSKVPKFLKGAKGGGILSAVISGGMKFAETGDTGQAVTQGAGAGIGAFAGGTLGALTGPLAPMMVPLGAAIGGIIGDYVTEELRKLGFLEPIEKAINNVVDVFRKLHEWMKPFYEGMSKGLNEFWVEIQETFKVMTAVFVQLGEDIKFLGEKLVEGFNFITNEVKYWWGEFDTNILGPMEEGFNKVVSFLKPILDPLEKLATKILNPLTTALSGLFTMLKKIPLIGKLFDGDIDDDDKKNAGQGLVSGLLSSPKIIMDVIQAAGGAYTNRQTGGPILVPGSQATSGDSVPAVLPTGSFVLNRNASNAIRRQSGGSVPAMLEPGELVFPKTTDSLKSLNSQIPRFQNGGIVNHTDTGSGFQPGNAKDQSGRPVVLSKGAADAFKKMMDAGGVKGSDVASSRRSVEKNKSVGGVPNSAHLGGNAIDIHGASKSWMIKNSDKYGWKRNNYMNDSWHWDYVGNNSTVVGKNEGNDDKKENKETEEKSISLSGLSGSLSGQLGFLKMLGINLTGLGGLTDSVISEGSSFLGSLFGINPGMASGLGMSPNSTDSGGGLSDGAFSANAMLKYAKANGITNKTELAMFMGQMGHESMGFTRSEEIASGADYEGRTDLGNTQRGDGKRYKGRGYIQLTGRDNYRTYGAKVGEDLENNPELAADPNVALKVAMAYWNDRVSRSAAKSGDLLKVTKQINGGTNGLEDRGVRFAKWQKKLSSDGNIAGLQKGGIPAMLEPGEMVFSSSSPQLEALNSSIPRFQNGGSTNISHSSSPSMDKLGAASGMSMGQTSIIVINGGGGNQQASAPPQLPQSQGVAPPMLPNGPSMAGLSDIINRVSWSSVF
jgi:putative chitinase